MGKDAYKMDYGHNFVQAKNFVDQYFLNECNGAKTVKKLFDLQKGKGKNDKQSIDRRAAIYAHELLSKPLVQELIKQKLDVQELTADWVLHRHKTLSYEAQDDGVKTRNVEDIGKALGIYKEVQEVKEELTINIDDDEFKEILTEYTKK